MNEYPWLAKVLIYLLLQKGSFSGRSISLEQAGTSGFAPLAPHIAVSLRLTGRGDN